MGNPAGIVTDQSAVQSCSLAGITLMRGKIVQLQQLQRSIETNWRDCEKARSSAELDNAMLLSLRLVKASCDAVLAIAEAAAPKPLQAPAKVVNAIYSGADPFASIAGKKWAGEKVSNAEWAKAANAALHAAYKAADPKAEDEVVASLQKVKVDVLITAIAQDRKSIGKDMLNYGWKIGEIAAKAADKVQTVAKKQVYAKFYKIGKAAMSAGLKFYQAYDDWKKDDMNGVLEGIKRSFKAQHLQVQQQIDALVKVIDECEFELAKAETGRMFTPAAPSDMVCR